MYVESKKTQTHEHRGHETDWFYNQGFGVGEGGPEGKVFE